MTNPINMFQDSEAQTFHPIESSSANSTFGYEVEEEEGETSSFRLDNLEEIPIETTGEPRFENIRIFQEKINSLEKERVAEEERVASRNFSREEIDSRFSFYQQSNPDEFKLKILDKQRRLYSPILSWVRNYNNEKACLIKIFNLNNAIFEIKLRNAAFNENKYELKATHFKYQAMLLEELASLKSNADNAEDNVEDNVEDKINYLEKALNTMRLAMKNLVKLKKYFERRRIRNIQYENTEQRLTAFRTSISRIETQLNELRTLL